MKVNQIPIRFLSENFTMEASIQEFPPRYVIPAIVVSVAGAVSAIIPILDSTGIGVINQKIALPIFDVAFAIFLVMAFPMLFYSGWIILRSRTTQISVIEPNMHMISYTNRDGNSRNFRVKSVNQRSDGKVWMKSNFFSYLIVDFYDSRDRETVKIFGK
jgi:hypothetical protein